VGIGFWHLHRLRKSCVPVDVAALSPILRKTLAEFDSSRVVKLCTSDQLRVPTAIGFMEPLVVIPTWTMRELSEPELNPILLHELAHLRRRDDWTNLAQKILSALLFFHPAVWWIEKKLTLEREMACDDLVLAETTSPRAYAECLVAMAERSCLRRGSALAQAAVDRLRHVALRVSQILDVDRPHATRVWRPAPVLVTGVSLVCLVALSHAPTRLVSFENTATPSSLASEIPSGDFARNAMAAMGAHVVPAELHMQRKEVRRERVPLAGKSSVSIVAKSAVKSPFRTMRKPEVFPASAAEHRVKAPLLVRSSMRDQAVAPRTLFLVMQTEVVQGGQYDDAPVVVWGLCVWQVTVTGPGQNQVVAGIIAKSI
jgi:bla regulator protein blaR1